MHSGTLFVVGTPIGNLGDMTPRAIETLRSVDVILAEDTRVTRKLCSAFDIDTPLERFDEHTSTARIPSVLERLLNGACIALTSDAGMPGVADPGNNLADAARDAGVEVIAIPGPSAVLAALSASGLGSDSFYFGGFIPRKRGEQRAFFMSVAPLTCPSVFFESPHRVAQTLVTIAELFPSRRVALARELTKAYEEIVRMPAPELAEHIAARGEIKGECVIVLGPPSEQELSAQTSWDDEDLADLLRQKMADGLSKSRAVALVAQETGVARNTLYALSLDLT